MEKLAEEIPERILAEGDLAGRHLPAPTPGNLGMALLGPDRGFDVHHGGIHDFGHAAETLRRLLESIRPGRIGRG
jgi:hypothetical protein